MINHLNQKKMIRTINRQNQKTVKMTTKKKINNQQNQQDQKKVKKDTYLTNPPTQIYLSTKTVWHGMILNAATLVAENGLKMAIVQACPII